MRMNGKSKKTEKSALNFLFNQEDNATLENQLKQESKNKNITTASLFFSHIQK